MRGDLVGREAELRAAVAALRPGSGGVLLVGEAGVGKTSLARAALGALSVEDDPEIIWLVASGSEPSIPFGAFAPFVPDIGGAPGRQPDPFFLLQMLRRAVLERSSGKPLILGVDDAHRLDSHSATLVYQLVAAGDARVVATVRPEPGGPPALRSLWKEELVERVDLEPLGYDDTLEYARLLLDGGELAGEVAEALWRTSGGNPLYLRELVRAGRRSGHIADREGLWRLAGELTVGPRLTELVRERIDSALPEELASLELCAFAGPLPMTVAQRLVGAEHLDGLQRAGLLCAERSRRELTVRVSHPLFAEALREAMPAARCAELARELAVAFEADGRRQEEMLRVVTWRLDAGDPVPADLLLQAALRAAERQDWTLSARVAEAAVAAGGGVEAALALADSQRALGHFSAALDALDALGAEEGDDDDQIARAAVLRACILSLGLARFDEADSILERAARRLADPDSASWVEAVRAGLLTSTGRPALAVAQAQLVLSRPGLNGRAELAARAAAALGLAWCGQIDQALALVADPPETGSHSVGWLATGWIKLTQTLAFSLSGRVADLEASAIGDYRLGVQLDNRHLQGQAAADLGWAALLRGELERASHWLREATTVFGPVDFPAGQAQALIGLVEVMAETGDLAGASAALEASRSLAERSVVVGARRRVAEARLAAAEGAVGEAVQTLEAAANEARAEGLVAYEIMALHGSVRLGWGEPAERLGQLHEATGNPLLATMVKQAQALSSTDAAGNRLDQVAEEYARRELRLFAAEAAAQASAAHRRVGDQRRATASAGRAHFLLGAVAGHRPLALSTAMTPPELTRREGEVAGLAARGLSSSAIAERLCLSVRTVDTHLARVYFKLGIGSRSELAPALYPVAGAGRHVEAG